MPISSQLRFSRGVYYSTGMKKLALSGLVIVLFVLYSFHQRNETAGPVLMPVTPSPTPPTSQQSAVGSSNPNMPAAPADTAAAYKDGTYTGSTADAFYGNVQVQAVVHEGKITAVQFLQHPDDNPTSRAINDQAMPDLQREAIRAQQAHVDIITGATDTSMAFVESLTSALAHAS